MSNWVKITKSKQLRYKLIAVMYLIFIALSAINIPIEWLHINKYLSPLLTETTIVSIDNKDLKAVYESVEETKKNFYEALGYDEETESYREPFGYAVTDAFFIRNGRGVSLQKAFKRWRNMRMNWALDSLICSMICLPMILKMVFWTTITVGRNGNLSTYLHLWQKRY